MAFFSASLDQLFRTAMLTGEPDSYVAMHTMQEESPPSSHDPSEGYMNGGLRAGRARKEGRMQDTLAAVAGMLIPLLTQFGHRH